MRRLLLSGTAIRSTKSADLLIFETFGAGADDEARTCSGRQAA